MQDGREMLATELNRSDRKILDKYTKTYSRLPEGANPRDERMDEDTKHHKEL